MNEQILSEIENLIAPGEIVIFTKANNGELIWNRHPDLEIFCLETLEGLKLQNKIHEQE